MTQKLENVILLGDALEQLRKIPDTAVQCVITSPPYWGLRNYGIAGQMGQEKTPEEYVTKMVQIFQEVKRVLKDDGTLWLNLGDSYAGSLKGVGRDGKQYAGAKQATNKGSVRGLPVPDWDKIGLKNKDLIGIPWMMAFALRSDGWYLRSDIIWAKPNPMPESVMDRPTRAHEYLFLLTRSARYYYNADAIRTPIKSETTKMPDGWDTGPGGHGNYHRNGREKGARIDKQRGHSRKHAGFNTRWDKMTKQEQQQNGANKRDVWWVATKPYRDAHFATFNMELIEQCVLAGSRKGDVVMDPFAGSGTTLALAHKLGRKYLGIELNPEYIKLAKKRIQEGK